MAALFDTLLEGCLNYCLQKKKPKYTLDEFKSILPPAVLPQTSAELFRATLTSANALFKLTNESNIVEIQISVSKFRYSRFKSQD